MTTLNKLKAGLKGALDPATWAGNVVLYHNGRCGSSVTASLLAQHPAIYWDGEVFRHEHTGFMSHLYYGFPSLYVAMRMARHDK